MATQPKTVYHIATEKSTKISFFKYKKSKFEIFLAAPNIIIQLHASALREKEYDLQQVGSEIFKLSFSDSTMTKLKFLFMRAM